MSRHNMQPKTLKTREYKGNIYVKNIRKIHVGSESIRKVPLVSGYGSEKNHSVSTRLLFSHPTLLLGRTERLNKPGHRGESGEVGGLVRLLPLGRGLALALAAGPAGHAHPLGRVRRLLEYLIRRVVGVPAYQTNKVRI
jgi:hypothetical protein